MPPKILIVDDDRHTRVFLERLLAKTAELSLAVDGREARQRFAATDFNLVLMDQCLPDANGIDLLRELRRQRPRLVAILMTGFADVRDAVAAVREGVFDYQTKPFEDIDALEAVIGKALELDQAYRDIDTLRAQLNTGTHLPVIVGQSPAMAHAQAQLQRVAGLDITVLLEGESGTGKDLAAKLIHGLSARSQQPYLEVNCGGLPETLLESLLFGFEKGAFTGAGQATAGYFEKAHGGTLFLDEIADMSPKLQSSLLRVLQDNSYTRIGSAQTRKADFRLVCATNRPLQAEVKSGRFREDLYYRIAVVTIVMPPLRERTGDILPLAMHFLEAFNAKFGRHCGPFTPAAVEALEHHPWEGNVRQLQHCVERTVALHGDGPIDDIHLFPEGFDGPKAGLELGPGPAESSQAALGYQDARASFERDYMVRLLEAAHGNVSEAARLSGIPRQNLYVRMKRWGIVTER